MRKTKSAWYLKALLKLQSANELQNESLDYDKSIIKYPQTLPETDRVQLTSSTCSDQLSRYMERTLDTLTPSDLCTPLHAMQIVVPGEIGT